MPESTNMLGLDVKIRSLQEDELFVKWVGLSTMVSSSCPILSLVSKEYYFEHLPLKSPEIIEIAGLRLLTLFIRMSRGLRND